MLAHVFEVTQLLCEIQVLFFNGEQWKLKLKVLSHHHVSTL